MSSLYLLLTPFIFLNQVFSHKCGTKEVFDEHLEKHTYDFIKKHADLSMEDLTYDTINIPIVWHVVYNTEEQNIPDEQLESQIDVLNEDFMLKNEDSINTPDEWKPLMANYSLHFHTHEIKRVYTDVIEWDMSKIFTENILNEDMKFSNKGGSDAIDTHNKLNVWVVNWVPVGLLGFAQFPGKYYRSPETDGLVLYYRYTGITDNSKGRTATHEIGHWLNLEHIWGNGGCNVDDGVSDTPIADEPHYSNEGYPTTTTCGTPDMFMNYMDYGTDSDLVMFTKGQLIRSRAIFAEGHVRHGFVNSNYNPMPHNHNNKLIYEGAAISIIVLLIVFFLIYSLVKCIYSLILKYRVSRENEVELQPQVLPIPSMSRAENEDIIIEMHNGEAGI